MWFRVPEVIQIRIEGALQRGVMAKDIILAVLGRLGPSAAVYKCVEFCGSTVDRLSVAERMVLCNMSVEMGAKTSYIQPCRQTLDYIRSLTDKQFDLVTTDDDYQYAATYDFNVEKLLPQAAKPGSVDSVDSVETMEPVAVHQAFIGTCTGGRLEDIAVAAKILRGKHIHAQTRLVVIPASRSVYLDAIRKGYVEALILAGATISAPGCGPCLGAHQGVLAPGEVCVTTSSRNFPGRMGSTAAGIYCVSPATAAASALTGRLTDPRPYLEVASV